ncbi:hypothetical protein A8D96_22655 [Burkholderia cenocepacia]|nr:hypothetical protein A8D93_22580 [Burkholderia cenocepacia]ONP98514.1 hypothetical protein A8D96_22655 [Burkholderia cenocepacia]
MLVQALRDVIDDPSALLTRLKVHALESRDILHAPVYDAAAELNAEESSFFRAVARAARETLINEPVVRITDEAGCNFQIDVGI